MFTGLIEQVGVLKKRELHSGSGKLYIQPSRPLENPIFGESVAVNGTCLTLEKCENDHTLVFHALEETFRRTNLGELSIGSKVNLERAMQLGDRFGGHIVSGHVDCVARVLSFKKGASDYELKVELPPQLVPFLIEKGSICIDGVSLTIGRLSADSFSVFLIPVTLAETALIERKSGELVNLEGDLIGKYVAKQLANYQSNSSNVTMQTLSDAGFMS